LPIGISLYSLPQRCNLVDYRSFMAVISRKKECSDIQNPSQSRLKLTFENGFLLILACNLCGLPGMAVEFLVILNGIDKWKFNFQRDFCTSMLIFKFQNQKFL
jgi:hypothetical protein